MGGSLEFRFRERWGEEGSSDVSGSFGGLRLLSGVRSLHLGAESHELNKGTDGATVEAEA